LRKTSIVLGLLLLAIAIIMYLYLSYNFVDIEVYDDKVTWYHSHIIKYISQNGDIYCDRQLWFISGKDLLRSPILLDLIVAKFHISSTVYVTLLAGVITIIVVFLTSFTIFKDLVISGLASFITMSIPIFLYWFKANNYGPYILGFLALLTMIVLSRLLEAREKRSVGMYTLLFIFMYMISWLAIPTGWIIGMIYFIYMLILMYTGKINVAHLYITILIFAASLSSLVVTKYVTIYHIAVIYMMLTVLIAGFLEYRFIVMEPSMFKRNIWRLSSIISAIALSIVLTYLTSLLIELPGLLEPYSKTYNPIIDTLSIVILGPPALVAYIKLKGIGNYSKSPLKLFMIIGFLITVILAYVEPSLTILEIAFITPLISYIIVEAFRLVSASIEGKTRSLYIVALIWVFIALIVGGAYGGYNIVTEPSPVYYSGIPPAGHGYKPVSKSGIIELLSYINESNPVILIHWERGLWITGLKNAYILADDHGDRLGRMLLSSIFISDETTARGLILKNIDVSKHNVYIIITEIVSVEKTGLGMLQNTMHIGRVYVVGEREGVPELVYVPFGDIASLPQYVTLSGHDLPEYIDLYMNVHGSFELPLAWNYRARESLLVKLLIDAIFRLGYNPVNDVISRTPIMRFEIPEPKYFKFVNATLTYIDTVTTALGGYDVYILTALYKFTP